MSDVKTQPAAVLLKTNSSNMDTTTGPNGYVETIKPEWNRTTTSPEGHKIVDVEAYLRFMLDQKIMNLDGAMGTMVQKLKLEEEDFRGKLFKTHSKDLKGNNDILCLTAPHHIADIHRQYYLAGSDICETNTFNGTTISMADYACEEHVYAINKQAAIICREVADEVTRQQPDKPRFVAGAIGPTNQTLSISPKVEDPGFRSITYDVRVREVTVFLPVHFFSVDGLNVVINLIFC